ncbi:hypothetical protein ES705_39365 [subsurface metagenome]
MLRDKYIFPVVKGERDLLKKLVREEIDRRCIDIDETIMRAYAVVPAKHTIEAIDEVKVAILVLVHSPLADLEKLKEALQGLNIYSIAMVWDFAQYLLRLQTSLEMMEKAREN